MTKDSFEVIQESGFAALEALATYQYLTAQQLADIGVLSSAKNIRDRVLPRLLSKSRPLVRYVQFPTHPTKGALSRVYALTQRGAGILAEHLRLDPEAIRFPVGGIQFTHDYFHRLAFVDFHIALRKWASATGSQVEFVDAYFEKIGAQRSGRPLTAKTQVRTETLNIIADGVFRVQIGEKRRLCVVEIHNNWESAKITEQLNRHITAVSKGLFAAKYQHPSPNFILSVHENQTTLDSTRKRLLQLPDFADFLPLVAFNLQSAVKEDFGNGWITADGSHSTIFSV